MNPREELDRQFTLLHQRSIADFEEKLRTRRDEASRLVEEQKPLQRQELERAARLLDIPAERITRSRPKEDAKLKGRIAEVEQSQRTRANRQAINTWAAQHPAFTKPGARSVPILATNIMASKQAEIASIEGQRGNPWVLPWNPGHVTIKQELWDTEYGLCGWARPHVNDPIVADVWFAFLADSFANWQFLVVADFHGFYILNANRGFWLCRDSRVQLDVSLNVYQYFWFGDQMTELLNEESDTGFRFGYYDQPQQFWYSAPLRADPAYYVFVRFRMSIHATAYGGYSQINFADGSNYINPLVLITWPQ